MTTFEPFGNNRNCTVSLKEETLFGRQDFEGNGNLKQTSTAVRL
jgi:hypothetical protein